MPAAEPAPASAPESLRDLAVVIVLFNSADVLAACLRSIPAQAEVVIVDNASQDGGAELARELRPDAVIVRSPRNLGFGAGCNLGWRATARPFVAFVNPDVRLRDDTLTRLLARSRSRPHTMVGPALLDGQGRVRPAKRMPSAWLDFLGLLPAAARWGPAGIDGKFDPQQTPGAGGPVEGACFVVARADLEAIAGFDEDFFLYYEEESLVLRLAALGGGAVYEPAASAEHAGATSTDKVGRVALRHRFRSRVIFYRKRDGELAGRLAGLLFVLAVLVRMPAVAVRALLAPSGSTSLGDLINMLAGLTAGLRAQLRAPAPP